MSKPTDSSSRPQPSDDDAENSPSDEVQSDDEGVIAIDLLPADNDNEYRIRNNPDHPFQRTMGSDYRKGAIRIKCKLVSVVHGTLSTDEPASSASLVVFECAFSSWKSSSRIKSLDIEFVFKGLGPNDPCPEVYDIAPKNKICLYPVTTHETITSERSGGVNVSSILGGAGGALSVKWQKTEESDLTKYITVIGESTLNGKDNGPANSAAWTLMENSTSREGIPQLLRVAILLKRENATSHFQCDLKITVNTNRRAAITGLFKSPPLDEPIFFDPRLPPADKKLGVYSPKKLEDVVLEDLSEITAMKIMSGIVRDE